MPSRHSRSLHNKRIGVVAMPPLAPGDECCDFCATPGVVWAYPAASVPVRYESGKELWVRGDWGACDACAALIEHDDYRGLTARACSALGTPPEFIGGLLETFRAHRSGPRRPYVHGEGTR